MRLYFKYLSVHVRGAMQYKLSFFFTVLAQFLVSFNVFLGVYFMLRRFHRVADFTYPQVLLCYTIVLTQYTLAELFFRGFDRFSLMLGNGQFDRILTRPRNTVFQVLCSRFDPARLGRVLQVPVLFPYALAKAEIHWTPGRVLCLLCMLLGGVLLFAAVFVLGAALSFFTTEGLEVVNILTDGAREHGKYPLGIYGKAILRFCTAVVPYALVQYYPLLYLLGRESSPFFIVLPLLAAWFLLPAWLLWRLGLRKYRSTGS